MRVEPPFPGGAVQVTVAVVLPAVALPIVGASGSTSGVAGSDRAEKAPMPLLLLAATWNLTALPLTKLVTTRLFASADADRTSPIRLPAASRAITE